MSDARTLPSDLFVPQVALDMFQVEFVTSLQAMKFFGLSPNFPVYIRGFDVLSQQGQFIEAPVLSRIASLDTARDITSDVDVDTLKVGSRNDRGVLINRKLGPVSLTATAAALAKTTSEGVSAAIGQQMARSMQETIQQYVIAALKGAISKMTSTLHTKAVWSATVRTNLTTSLLAQLKALLGDSTESIVGWIMRSEVYNTDLITSNLGAGVTGIADVVGNGGPAQTLGIPYALVDDSNLTTADGGFDKYYTLGLGAGCIEVEFTRPLVIYPPERRLKSENVEDVIRGDYDFAIRIPGFQWSNAQANPSVANCAATTYWTVGYADHREVKAVLGEHNYSGN